MAVNGWGGHPAKEPRLFSRWTLNTGIRHGRKPDRASHIQNNVQNRRKAPNVKPAKSNGRRKSGAGGLEVYTSGVMVKMPSLRVSVLSRSETRWLAYSQAFTLTSGSSGVTGTGQAFSINSAFDPDISGTGHQPYGYDQLSLFFNSYQVLGFRAKIVANTIGASSDQMILFSLLPSAISNSALNGITIDAALEKPFSGALMLTSSGNGRNSTVQLSLSPWEVEGVTRTQYTADMSDFRAVVTSSPNLQQQLVISNASPSLASAQVCTVVVYLEYLIEFSAPKIMAQS